MHIDVCANPRIGQYEADGMVDVTHGKFIGIKEQWRNGKTRSVGAGALLPASRRRIDTVEIPHRNKLCDNGILCNMGRVGFVKFAVAAVDYDELAVALARLHVAS